MPVIKEEGLSTRNELVKGAIPIDAAFLRGG